MQNKNALKIQRNFDLASFTSFGFSQQATHYAEVATEQELAAAVSLANDNNWKILALGEGSNLVLTKDFEGLVIRQTSQDIHYDISSKQTATVTASAGVNWHYLVTDTVNKNLAGLENLSLIPGTVGAAPVQNIGAYGVEIGERLISLRAIDITSGQWLEFSRKDCQFGYRHSVFKSEPDRYIISSVTFELDQHPTLRTDYNALAEYLNKHTPNTELTPKLVSDAVCAIRAQKLPDPAVLPNAGSFFHNPVISDRHFQALKLDYPDIVGYKQENAQFKVAAGWLVERLGYKGFRENGVGVHEMQALVLIRYAEASGADLMALAARIQHYAKDKFDIDLTVEPRIL